MQALAAVQEAVLEMFQMIARLSKEATLFSKKKRSSALKKKMTRKESLLLEQGAGLVDGSEINRGRGEVFLLSCVCQVLSSLATAHHSL